MDFKLKKNSFNFRVYTSASIPESGNENDVVVVSNIPMENWILSPDEPSGAPRTDGDVWITYSTSGNVLNILKQDSMMIAPISAKQYIDGAWVDVEAKTYQNGVWVDWWNGELYVNGNEYEAFTGGMTAYAYKLSGTSAAASAPVITKGTNAITIQTGTSNSGTVYINKMFDLSKYSKMVMKITGCTGHEIRVGFTETKATDFTLVAYTLVPTGSASGTYTGTIELDLSGASRTCYPVITMMNTGTKTITFTEWRLVS